MAWKIYSHLLGEGVCRNNIEIYHASLTLQTKSRVYRAFRNSSSCIRCLIATVAFGMVCFALNCDHHFKMHTYFLKGMDIPDIEIVCVYGCPKTISQLYQVL